MALSGNSIRLIKKSHRALEFLHFSFRKILVIFLYAREAYSAFRAIFLLYPALEKSRSRRFASAISSLLARGCIYRLAIIII